MRHQFKARRVAGDGNGSGEEGNSRKVMLRTRSEYVSRIGGGPDRPKRDISPEPEAARDGGLEERRVDEGWEGERGERGWGGKGRPQKLQILLGMHARGKVSNKWAHCIRIFSQWSGYSSMTFLFHTVKPAQLESNSKKTA